jgi:hypothetical protein
MTTHVSARPGCRDWWMQIVQGEKNIYIMGTFITSFTDYLMNVMVVADVCSYIAKDLKTG